MVRLRHIVSDLVSLPDGDVIQMRPVDAAIARDVNSAVDADNHVIGIGRIDPHGVKIGVNLGAPGGRECLAAILRVGDAGQLAAALQRGHPDAQVVVRVDKEIAEVRRIGIGAAHLDPGLAVILAAVQAAVRRAGLRRRQSTDRAGKSRLPMRPVSPPSA